MDNIFQVKCVVLEILRNLVHILGSGHKSLMLYAH